jgi:hypothetical protein
MIRLPPSGLITCLRELGRAGYVRTEPPAAIMGNAGIIVLSSLAGPNVFDLPVVCGVRGHA